MRGGGAGKRAPSCGACHSIPAAAVMSVEVPLFVGLTDAQRRSAEKKLIAGLKKMKQVQLAGCCQGHGMLPAKHARVRR